MPDSMPPAVAAVDTERDQAIESEFYRIAAELDCRRFGDDESKAQFALRLLQRVEIAINQLRDFERDARLALDLYSNRAP